MRYFDVYVKSFRITIEEELSPETKKHPRYWWYIYKGKCPFCCLNGVSKNKATAALDSLKAIKLMKENKRNGNTDET